MLQIIYEICCNFHPAIGLVYASVATIVTAIVSRIVFAVIIRSSIINDDLKKELTNVTRGGMLKRLAWIKQQAHVLPKQFRILAGIVRVVSYLGYVALAWALIIIFGPIFIYSRPL